MKAENCLRLISLDFTLFRPHCILNFPDMIHRQTFISAGIALVCTALTLISAGCTDSDRNDRTLVVTSISPLGNWIAEIGGDDLDVLVLVPPSSSPHTFELSPGQLRDASRAQLVVFNGAGLEYWSEKLLENLQNPATPVLTLSNGVELLQDGSTDGQDEDPAASSAHDSDTHGHSKHRHGAAGNPHFWLDPHIASSAIDMITEALSALLPSRANAMRIRADKYLKELAGLDSAISTEIGSWTEHRFIGDHSSWVYFAKRYGLKEISVIEEIPGREISAREMASLVDLIRKEDIKAVFADKRKSTRAVDILAEETNICVVLLDPMGIDGMSYLDLMRFNVTEMSKVMR